MKALSPIPNMAELQRYRVNLGDLPETRQWRAGRTFASELGLLDSIGQVVETVFEDAIVPRAGDVKAQGVRIADIAVFGPLMIYSGLGKNPPTWVRLGLILIGVGTILYNLQNYITVQGERADAGIAKGGFFLGQMQAGPWHRVADLERVQRLSPGAYRKTRPGGL